jgi:hypothetical protein
MRIAFTILLNGKKHLLHNDYCHFIPKVFDYWIIAEGVAKNTGSTSWCKELPADTHNNFLSNDGTTELLDELASKYKNIKIIRSNNGFWSNKDEQVNACIVEIKDITNSCKLWQIDIDEQWTKEQIELSEKQLDDAKGKTGCFYCNYFVGKNQIVYGEWGEGKIEPYRRLWNWSGENFVTHEPPKLEGKNGPGILLSARFNHYSYYFEGDVIFKEKYYSQYDGLHKRWLDVQKNTDTVPIRKLLGDKVWWSNTNTIIKYTGDAS